MTARRSIDDLIAIMARLRHPSEGCPWDIEQTFATIVPYTIEEAYEVADAVARNDSAGLCEELGDLLLQVVFHARMAEETGAFDFRDVVHGVAEKMIARHPHVFGDATRTDARDQRIAWEAQKADERAARAAGRGDAAHGVLADVARALPALMRAEKLTARAARVGFDWPDAARVIDKLNEERDELQAELDAEPRDPDRIEDEVGDLLFVMANLARKLGIDPETALRRANDKFTRRFNDLEAALHAGGRTPAHSGPEEMDALWNRAKAKGL